MLWASGLSLQDGCFLIGSIPIFSTELGGKTVMHGGFLRVPLTGFNDGDKVTAGSARRHGMAEGTVRVRVSPRNTHMGVNRFRLRDLRFHCATRLRWQRRKTADTP
jgi:hypothetical protein